jgi:hypothetical protein
MKPSAWAISAAWTTSASLASGRPKRKFSSTVPSKSSEDWVTSANCARRLSSDPSRTSTPSMAIRPACGRANPSRSDVTVLFPAPLSPTRAIRSPLASRKERPASAGRAPPPSAP